MCPCYTHACACAFNALRARASGWTRGSGHGVAGRVAFGPDVPRPRDKAKVHKELGYRTAGMVGVNLTVARPMVKAQGHIVQLIGPDEDVDSVS